MEKIPEYLIDALVVVSICEQLAQKLEARADEIERMQARNESMLHLQHDENSPAKYRVMGLREAAIFIRDQYNQLEEPCTSPQSKSL